MFNFRHFTHQRKYFNGKNFPIYSTFIPDPLLPVSIRLCTLESKASQLPSVQIHIQSEHVCLYCSLVKENPWAEHLTNPSKRWGVGGGGHPFVLSHLTTKECLCHVNSDYICPQSKLLDKQEHTTEPSVASKSSRHHVTIGVHHNS